MGRWAQRRRRGGGPSSEGPPVVPAALVVSVTFVADFDVEWVFDQPLTLAPGSAPFGLLITAGGILQACNGAAQTGPSTVVLTYGAGGQPAPGDPWDVSASPSPDIVFPGGIVVPQSGTIL